MNTENFDGLTDDQKQNIDYYHAISIGLKKVAEKMRDINKADSHNGLDPEEPHDCLIFLAASVKSGRKGAVSQGMLFGAQVDLAALLLTNAQKIPTLHNAILLAVAQLLPPVLPACPTAVVLSPFFQEKSECDCPACNNIRESKKQKIANDPSIN